MSDSTPSATPDTHIPMAAVVQALHALSLQIDAAPIPEGMDPASFRAGVMAATAQMRDHAEVLNLWLCSK